MALKGLNFIERVFSSLYQNIITKGSLEVSFASGHTIILGDNTGTKICIKYRTQKSQWAVAFDPLMKAAEAYVKGDILIEEGDLKGLLILFQSNSLRRKLPWWAKVYAFIRYGPMIIRRILPWDHAEKRAAHHYDLSLKMYKMFLDKDLQYTCAYYETDDQSLYDAQRAKKRHIIAKLRLKSDHRILEMGCGWGGLALYMAEVTGAHVTAVNLSKEQMKVARLRAEKRNLSDRTTFITQDYRDSQGQYDRIVSVGMLEHVGKGKYDETFKLAKSCLKRDGVMLIHSICRAKPTLFQQPWSDKYIFPGAYVPSLAEVIPSIERASLIVKDVEIISKHYAYTLRDWQRNFQNNKVEILNLLDEEFYRMWDLYLAASEVSFTHARLAVFQIIVSRRHDALPIHRDYIEEEKRILKEKETMLFKQDSS